MAKIFWILNLALTIVATTSYAEGRFAFVVGNSDYQFTKPTPNAIRDSELISVSLEELGFEVTLVQNMTTNALVSELEAFEVRSADADMIFLYFAGHGVSIDSGNYLLGTEVKVTKDSSKLQSQLALIDFIETGKSGRTLIAFIDACRDDPFSGYGPNATKSGGMSRLSSFEAGVNHYIGMSAQVGKVALDGDPNGNGPFAQALSRHISAPITIPEMFQRVSRQVVEDTEGAQRPVAFETSLLETVCIPEKCEDQGNREATAKDALLEVALLPSGPAKRDGYLEIVRNFQGTKAVNLAARAIQEEIRATAINVNNPRALRLLKAAEDRYFSDIQDQTTLEMFLAAGDAGSPYGFIKAAHILDRGIGHDVSSDGEKAQAIASVAIDTILSLSNTDTKALYYLSLAQQYGLGMPVDLEASFKSALAGAEKGDLLAQNSVGISYRRGKGVGEDFQRAGYWFGKAAGKLTLAKSNLGSLLLDKQYQYESALTYLQEASEEGSLEASAQLARMYMNGYGVNRDYKAANDLFEKAGYQGGAFVLRNLASLHLNKNFDGYDPTKAVKMIRENIAIYPDDYRSHAMLGWRFAAGQGVAADRAKAIELLEQAASLGDPQGITYIGDMYRNGTGGEVNYSKANQYFRRALKEGAPIAGNKLGYMYEKGLGVEKNGKKAVEFYQLSVDRGVAVAARNMGVMYREGIGVDRDYDLAEEYFLESARLGDRRAYFYLGKLLTERVEPADNAKALSYYQIGSEKGDLGSTALVGYMHQQGLATDPNPERAFQYYKLAADGGLAWAASWLGRKYYAKGFGVEESIPLAMRYLEKAVSLGHCPSSGFLVPKAA